MERDERNSSNAAGGGPFARERESLTPLSSMDTWKVSEDEPDIRGWDVQTLSGRRLGAVADLLIDAEAGVVRMLDIDLPGTDRHTFVPFRVVRLDRARHVVVMDSADLPETDVARAERPRSSGRRAVDSTSVRYSGGDRDVTSWRAQLADGAPANYLSGRNPSASEQSDERRRGERRRIDRISTDL